MRSNVQSEYIHDVRSFSNAHHTQREQLENYLAINRKGSRHPTGIVRMELGQSGYPALCANNIKARMLMANLAAVHIRAALEELPGDTPIYWITLAPKKYVMTEEEAAGFNEFRLQQWARGILGKLDFVGIVDAALYTNTPAAVVGNPRAISFHVHLIAWGQPVEYVERILAQANRRWEVMTVGAKLAHVRLVDVNEAIEKVFYMMKRPQKEYRLIPVGGEFVDPCTGEVHRGRYDQRKRPLRSRDLVAMLNAMQDKLIDRLMFGGGEQGKTILERIRWRGRAMQRLRHQRPHSNHTRRR